MQLDVSAALASTNCEVHSEVHALCFAILSQSPSIISIFSRSPSRGQVVYQNLKSEFYYGNLPKDDPSSFTRVLSRLFSFDETVDVDFDIVMSHIETSGSWTGCIKVPASSNHVDHTPRNSELADPQSMHLVLSDNIISAPAMSAPLLKGGHSDLDKISATFRKAPKRVKSFLLPTIHSMLSESNGSGSRSSDVVSMVVSADRMTLPQIPEVNAAQSEDYANVQERQGPAVSPQSAPMTASKLRTTVGGSTERLQDLRSSEVTVDLPARAVRPPPLPFPPSDQGLTSALAPINKSGNETGFQWHEINLQKIQHPTTGEPLILVTQNDVTVKVAMEKSMLNCASTQLNMILSIFPLHVVEYFNLKKEILSTRGFSSNEPDIGNLARSHKDVTILFMDIVGFTSMSKEVEPQVVMKFLNDLFGAFDESIEEYKVQKVETAGDCYIVAAGVLSTSPDGFSEVVSNHDPRVSATRVLSFAQLMLHRSKMIRMPNNGEPVTIRIGVHTGDCVSGLVGSKLLKFGLFGDSMNTASRMESTSHPGKIQISGSTYSLLNDRQKTLFQATGGVEVKGKGLMDTYLWIETPFCARTTSYATPRHSIEDSTAGGLYHSTETSDLARQHSSAPWHALFDVIPTIDLMSSIASRASTPPISPYEALTQACHGAVSLLSSIAESRRRSTNSRV